MSSATPVINGRFAHVDALRAFSVMLVVVAHAGAEVVPGGSGVTMFLAISGFVITYQLIREQEKTNRFDAQGFYLRRLAKLAPVFILLIIIPSLLQSLFSGLSASAFLSQIFFSFNWFSIYGGSNEILPGSGVVWSLAIEEQFYILFAIFWIFVSRRESWMRYLVAISVLSILASTILRMAIFDGGMATSDRIYYGTDTRLDGIAWGILAAIIYYHWQKKENWLTGTQRLFSSDMVLIAIAMLWLGSLAIRDHFFRDTLRYSVQSFVAFAFILYGLASGSGPIRNIFTRITNLNFVLLLGLASYSIYLAHNGVIHFLKWAFDLGTFQLGPLVILGCGAGVLVYLAVERPLNNRLRSWIRNRKVAEAPVPIVGTKTT